VDHLGRSARKPGSVICGKWRIEALLRQTPTSATYSALHRNGARIALKILHAHLSSDKTLQARFRREAYVANTIPHPDTVKVIDDDETDDGCALLVMDHFDGETLEELRTRKGGKLPLEMACAFADQLLDIIAAAHDQGVVHRDIKAETVFITKEGRVKVHDFGTARVLSETSSPQEMTAAGMVVGSPSSMAPEQARGQRDLVDAQSDIFSLGALLFTLLSGEPVHKISNPLAALVAAAKTKAPSLRTVTGPEIPDAVVEVVDRALQFKKADRWPDARAFRAALRAARGELIDTFPQAGRRDPLADLMSETSENDVIVLTNDAPIVPAPPKAPQRPPLAPESGTGPTSPLVTESAPERPRAPQAPKAPARPPPMPPALPSAANGPSAPRVAARAPTSGPERRAAERAGQPPALPEWQRDEDVEDGPTVSQVELDPSLVQALAEVRREAVAVAPTKAVPRVGPGGPPRPGPPRPSGIPRPGPRTEPPPRVAAEARAPEPPPIPAAPKVPDPPRSAPLALPAAAPAAPFVEKDPRFATVVMANSPALPPESLRGPVYDAEVVEDDATQVVMSGRPAPLAITPPTYPNGGAFGSGPPPAMMAPPAGPGFGFGPPQAGFGPHVPTPFEVIQPAPPPPYEPPPMNVAPADFPGRRMSMHEDLRILVPEQSYSLDHNPFADAARRKKRLTIGIVVGIVAVVAVALIAMLRSG
jgi:serine/threonine protein kinase